MSEGFTQGVYNYKNKRFDDAITAGNIGSTETIIYSYNVPAGSFQSNGDTMFAQFMGSGSNNGNTKYINLYWGTTSLASTFNNGSTNLSQNSTISFDSQSAWYMSVLIIRSDTGSFRSCVSFEKTDVLILNFSNFNLGVNYRNVSGANFNNSNPLILTTSASISNDMFVHFSNVVFK
jgi:hypothetical protein